MVIYCAERTKLLLLPVPVPVSTTGSIKNPLTIILILILIFITFWPLTNRRNTETYVCDSKSQKNMLNIAPVRHTRKPTNKTQQNSIQR